MLKTISRSKTPTVLVPFINIHTHQISAHPSEIIVSDYFTTLPQHQSQLYCYSAGLHPWLINEIKIETLFKELQMAAAHKNCVAIGECGLDKLKGPSIQVQLAIFEQQLLLAIDLKKPVIVHCVQAFDILLSVIKRFQNKIIFIVHGFRQNMQTAMQLVQHGAYLSFGAALTNKNNEKLQHVFLQTPTTHIFLENDDTDCSIDKIYEEAAAIKKCELHVMKEIIFANYKKVIHHE